MLKISTNAETVFVTVSAFVDIHELFRDSANIRNPLALRPHVWRVPNSNALSCKHEQLSGFHPLVLANFCACGHFFLGNHESQLAVLILSAEDHSLGKNACQFGGFEVYKNHYLLADHLFR